jgi:hypothetical protein
MYWSTELCDSRPSPGSVADRVVEFCVACMLHAALPDRTLSPTLDYQDLPSPSFPNHARTMNLRYARNSESRIW